MNNAVETARYPTPPLGRVNPSAKGRTPQLRALQTASTVLPLLIAYGSYSSETRFMDDPSSPDLLAIQAPATGAKLMLFAESQASTEPSQADWSIPVATRLQHLARLVDGWDGPGSTRIDREVVAKAWRLLVTIAPPEARPPSISPGRDGSLQLAWYTRDFELEIDIPQTGDMAFSLYDQKSGREIEGSTRSPELLAGINRLSTG
jgi:hypothetical protein